METSSRLGFTTFGAFPTQDGVEFAVWAPEASKLELVLFADDGKAQKNTIALKKDEQGIYRGTIKEASVGSRYKYLVDGNGPFPDPASRFQPDGVHGCSMVMDNCGSKPFPWNDSQWKGIDKIERMIIYELHVGTFTQEGTFQGVKSKLSYLKNELGVTAIELLPLADFPGRWNWGYDGVCLYAPARCYGNPDELRDLVNAAHELGLAVIIDLVYNHLGPDGNYLSCYNPHFFTKKFNTPWGAALNYDLSSKIDENADEETKKAGKEDLKHAKLVRQFIIDNALYWLNEFHFDGFRLDATHAIVDYSTPHVLQELISTCKDPKRNVMGKPIIVLAEDDRNEAKLAEIPPKGTGISSLWADDFHHQVRVMMNGDNESYFANFTGTTNDLVDTIRKGWFFCGQPVPDSGEHRGTDPQGIPLMSRFCYCIQNHDQIGNRAMGERLNHQITMSSYKTASALLLLCPELPMLFQGQEFASNSPFQFFTDHNAELGKLVTEGRRREFAKFSAFNDPKIREKIPDPQAESTFKNSKLLWQEKDQGNHASMLKFYRTLIQFRLDEPAMQNCDRSGFEVHAVDDGTVSILRKSSSPSEPSILAVLHMKGRDHSVELSKLTTSGKVNEKNLSVVFTSEDEPFHTEGTKGAAPPKIEQGAVRFNCPSAIIMRMTQDSSPQTV